MDKKFFAFMMAVAMLSACGSQDIPEETPPPPPDYSKYPNIDNDLNNKEANAVNIEDKGSIITGYTFTGSLSTKSEIGEDGGLTSITMDVDYYKLKLKRRDSLSITVSNNSSPFRFRFYGPCYDLLNKKLECADTTVIVKNKTASLGYRIKSGHEQTGVDLAGAKATFHIKVFNSLEDFQQNEFHESNPYLITVKLADRD